MRTKPLIGNLIWPDTFAQRGTHAISEQNFYGTIWLAVVRGLFATAAAWYIAIENSFYPTWIFRLILWLGAPLLGIYLVGRSKDIRSAILAYHLILIPFGLVLAPLVHIYSPHVITKAFVSTWATTAIMTLLSLLNPGFFSKLGGILFYGLIGLIVMRLLQRFFPSMDVVLIDYLAVALFSLYIGYDVWRAQHVQRTYLTALNIAVSLYLDIINLFLSLLRLFGRE